MEENEKLAILEQKIDDIKSSVDKIKKIFLWTIILSIALVVLPLLGLAVAIPQILSTYSGYSSDLNP